MDIYFDNTLIKERKNRYVGVYKVTFNDKWIYIGSSVNLKKRIARWRCVLKNGYVFTSNKNLNHIKNEVTFVNIEILQILNSGESNLEYEKMYIEQYKNNPFLVNRNLDPIINGNRKRKMGDNRPVKKNRTHKRPVGYFENDILLCEFDSATDAMKKLKLHKTTVWRSLSGTMKLIKGKYHFRYKNKFGQFNKLEHPIPKNAIKKISVTNVQTGKIKIYPSKIAVFRSIGLCPKSIGVSIDDRNGVSFDKKYIFSYA